MTSQIAITVIVPVKNEEKLLPACLQRLDRFSEVIVIDSNSTDATREIARKAGAEVHNFEWNGTFPKKRNWALLNLSLKNDWVLFLDADELVDEAFCNAAEQAVRSDQHNGYWLDYTNYFLGKPLRHGIPQRKLALFRIGSGLYEKIDEEQWSNLDMEVHEHPIIEGSIGEIDARIDHKDDRGILRFVDRHRDYAVWEANRVRSIAPKLGGAKSGLTDRQKFKYKSLRRWWFPYAYFLGQYIWKLGILDGHAGLQYAWYKFWYFSTIRLILIEGDREAREQV
ncbi:MAG: glycosyltransferase family 2 protein [Pseudomonadota bacterium]